MDFTGPLKMIAEGLALMAKSNSDAFARKLELLSRFERRAAWVGEWTWADFAIAPDELARLHTENLTLADVDTRCRALLAKDAKTQTKLIREIEKGPAAGMVQRVQALVAGGEDPNGATLLKDVPLGFAHYHGHREVFDALITLGADPDKVGFSPLHMAVRYGTLAQVADLLESCDVLQTRPDAYSVLEEAVRAAQTDKLSLILGKIATEGRMADAETASCFEVAIGDADTVVVEAFLAHGANPDAGLDATTGTFDLPMLELLLAHGADVHRLTDLSQYHEDASDVMDAQGRPAITAYMQRILAAGWRIEDLAEYQQGQIRYATGACLIAEQDLPDKPTPVCDQFTATFNPTEVTAPYHLEMLRTGDAQHSIRHNRLADLPKPSWTADRFGQSTTHLPDGRWVQIGGEHEDSYDSDFVILSDVVVQDGKGGARIFFYPASAFPPTDSHSATLIGDAIWIIGNVGYQWDRIADTTPVYRLCLTSFAMEKVEVTGQAPGWIGRHKAKVEGDRITVSGGQVWTGARFVDFEGAVVLDTARRVWADV